MPVTYKNLYRSIYDFDNLLEAYTRARRGKQQTDEMRRFHFTLEMNLWDLHAELKDATYRPGPYHHFRIVDPKPRQISAAPFRDRIVHHALCLVIQPLFERKFIYDSYANRTGKGTHKAVDRAHRWVRHFPYVLKMDILKFFPSVDHAVLQSVWRRTIACKPTLDLCGHILAGGKGALANEYPMQWFPGDDLLTPLGRARGLPIGNLTSQFWASVLLNELDHFVVEQLRPGPYLRYVDDFLVFGETPRDLWAARDAVADFLTRLRLSLHPRKCQVMPTAKGVPFLGFRLFPTHRRLLGDGLNRARRRLRRQRLALARGELAIETFRRSLVSWIGHAQHGDTFHLRRQLLTEHVWPVARSTA